MRFLNFINDNEYTSENIIKILHEKCSNYISDNLTHEHMLYRGIQNANAPLLVHSAHINRNPVDTNKEFHDIVNTGFKSVFGSNLRSESFFCTPNKYLAKNYGQLYVAFPSNDYKIYWSLYINDLYAIDIWIDNINIKNNNTLAFIALYSILHFNKRRLRYWLYIHGI